ncbi:MAG: DUF4394 domain-containing protein [Fimbriimonadaceae bacterium]
MKIHYSVGFFIALGLFAQSASAINVYGLTDRDQLVTFDSGNPNLLTNSVFISGLASNETVLGIDIRPSNNSLYAVGSFGNVYILNRTTGMATFQASLFDSVTNNALAMMGTEFGIDFNPAADRLRVVSNSGQNLRVNVATGATVVDGTLNQPAGTPYLVGAAYTNNDNDPLTGTTLYTVDSNLDVLNIQNPPNNGTQALVGALGVNVSALGDIDIFTNGTSNMAFGAFQVVGDTGSRFGSVDLMTGALTLGGYIGSAQSNNSVAIRGIAVETVPEPASMGLLAFAVSGIVARRRLKK